MIKTQISTRPDGVRRAAFLDRDGTIIVDKSYLSDPEGVVFEKDTVAGMQALIALGYLLIVVTNQSGVGRGMYTLDMVHAVNERVSALLSLHGVNITAWYICPHVAEDDCECRKPRPGLILRAKTDFDIDLQSSVVIGDKISDVQLGRAVMARSILVQTGYGIEATPWAIANNVEIAATLYEAAAFLSKR